MPILLAFVVCEKAIFDKESNSVSLIGVLHDIFIPVIRHVQIPPDTQAPLSWTAISIWFHTQGDEAQMYEQCCTLFDSNGNRLLTSEITQFQMLKPAMRVYYRFISFPVHTPGQCWLRLFLRTVGVSEWTSVATYPLMLHHTYYPA